MLFLGLVLFCAAAGRVGAAQTPEEDALPVIDSAESLFKAMKAKDYPAIWSALTSKSRRTIAEDIRKEEGRLGNRYSVDLIEKDLSTGGTLARSYWDSFLRYFNPVIVLEQSTWKMGNMKKDTAEIVLLYNKSERPANLKMFKENNQWRVGLTETFWNRK
jgi:hypothetical protein